MRDFSFFFWAGLALAPVIGLPVGGAVGASPGPTNFPVAGWETQAASQKRWAEARYRPPVGWAESGSGNTRVFSAPGADRDQAVLLFSQSAASQGDFVANFDRAVAALTQGKTVITKTAVSSGTTAEGYPVRMQVVVTEEAGGGGRILTQLAVVRAPAHVWLCAFVGRSEATCRKYNGVLAQFLKDLTFDTAAPAARTGSVPAPAANPAPESPATLPAPSAVTRSEASRRVLGHIRGRIYDAQGRPFRMAGIRPHIHLFGKTAEGDSATADAYAGENGEYDFKAPTHGLYVVRCFIDVILNGHPIQVELDQMDDRPTNVPDDSTPGIVKDFALKLTGPVKGQRADSFAGYHGGGVYVTDGGNFSDAYFGSMLRKYPAGTKAVVTLTPLSNRIDGSPARPITFTCDPQRMQTGATQANIPLAVYRVTASLALPDGKRIPLQVAALPAAQYAASQVIDFAPDPHDPNRRVSTPNLLVKE